MDLHILVPRRFAEQAATLLEEFHAEDPSEAPPEMRGPFRDDFDEDEDDSWKTGAERKKLVRRAQVMALAVPIGGGHLAARAYARGLLLFAVVGAACMIGVNHPMFLWLWPLAVVVDVCTVHTAIDTRLRERARLEEKSQ